MATLAASLVLAPSALSATTSPPTPSQVQAAADAALLAHLGWDRPARSLVVTEAMPAEAGGYFQLGTDAVAVQTSTAAALLHPRWPGSGDAMRTIVHEGLHYLTGCYSRVEEWITDAKAFDETPRTLRAVWGEPMSPPHIEAAGYPGGVRAIRALSARATGSKTWRTPDAWAFRDALWRSPMLLGGCAVREEMLTR
jgi:hypothetical protein